MRTVLIALVLVASMPACRGPERPAPLAAPQRTVEGYPLRFRVLTKAERDQRAHDAGARNPGWSIEVGPFGFLKRARHVETAAQPMGASREDQRSLFEGFIANNLELLGLDAMPTLPPLTANLPKLEQAAISAIVFYHGEIAGHFLPGWREWPTPLTDDELLTPFVGLRATVLVRSCPDADADQHQCDPVGPGDCQGPQWGAPNKTRLAREDLYVGQRYWYPRLSCAHREVEFRFVVEERLHGPCRGGLERSLSADLPAYLDGITGEGLPPAIAASTETADELCK